MTICPLLQVIYLLFFETPDISPNISISHNTMTICPLLQGCPLLVGVVVGKRREERVKKVANPREKRVDFYRHSICRKVTQAPLVGVGLAVCAVVSLEAFIPKLRASIRELIKIYYHWPRKLKEKVTTASLI